MRSYYQKRCCLIQNLWVSAAFLFILVAAVFAPRANGQMAAGTADDNQWHWDLSLPAWGPAIDGTISFSGHSSAESGSVTQRHRQESEFRSDWTGRGPAQSLGL